MDYAIQIGQRIKAYRTARSLTVKELAAKAQITPSMLSQIERGQANPSLNTIRQLSAALDEPMFRFFLDDVNVQNEVVRLQERKRIIEFGVEYEMLTPDTNGSLEMMQLTLSPGKQSCAQLRSHAGEEVALVQQGSIELMMEEETCLLHAGDSVRIKSGIKHCWRNPGRESCVLIFAVSPPDF
ncbi:cupin domain-containing protein [uncultured Oscillibacter sp.]|uniref:cupin domain-containing protein n=1 Tax=uncultured Oscillibacter sp. TaxID=876091 RepID=UPI0025E5F7AF|nr:cupin domain-containing protein [uncultured Oscillibacter sp.]